MRFYRWQLQRAGKYEETMCRFCHQKQPDWHDALASVGGAPRASPMMAIMYKGQVVRIRVEPGPKGQEEFKRVIRQMCGTR